MKHNFEIQETKKQLLIFRPWFLDKILAKNFLQIYL